MSKMNFRLCLLVACLLVVQSSPTQGFSLLGLKLDLNSVLSPLGLGRKAPAGPKPEASVDEDKTVVREARQVNPGTSTPAVTDSVPADAKPVAENETPADDAATNAPGSSAGPDEPAKIQPVTDEGVAVVDEPTTAAPEITPETPVDPAIDESATVVPKSKTAEAEESKPVSEDPTTSAPEKKPAEEDSKPVVDESSSVAPEVAPSEETKPIVEESEKSVPKVESSADKGNSVAEDSKPVPDESSTSPPQSLPLVAKRPTAASADKKAAPEESAAAKNPKPVDITSSTSPPEVKPVTPRAGANDTAPTDPASPPIICKRNEEYAECKDVCAKSCDRPFPPRCYSIMCKPGCNCKRGYFRDSLDRCILPIFCPFDKAFPWLKRILFDRPHHECGRNAEYSTCSNFCVKTCKYPNRVCALESMSMCTKGCVCKDGYVLNKYGRCVRVEYC